MKKLLIPILILPLMFFTGCSDEEETVAASTESYTISDLVGTWSVTSSNISMSGTMDFEILMAGYGYGADVLAAMAAAACADEGGTLSGLVCSISATEQDCCEEGQSQTYTVAEDGTYTLTDIMGDDSETTTGTITVNGTDLTLTGTDGYDTFSTTGTLSISGTTATFDVDIDMSYYNMTGISVSASQTTIAEKQ